MTLLNKIVTRTFYYPSLGYSAAMRSIGLWRKWDRVDECVLLGGVPSRRDIKTLAQIGVSGIVNLCEEFRGHAREMAAAGMTQLHLPTLDFHCPAAGDLLRGADFLMKRRAAGVQTYVHCKVGRARSATLVLCYLIAALNVPAEEAFRRLKSIRPQVTSGLHLRPTVVELEGALRAYREGVIIPPRTRA